MPGKMARSDPRAGVRVTRGAVAVSTSRLSCKRAGKTRTLMPVLGYIWRISVKRRLSWLESCQSGLSSALAVPVVPEHDNRTNTAERFKGGQTQ